MYRNVKTRRSDNRCGADRGYCVYSVCSVCIPFLSSSLFSPRRPDSSVLSFLLRPRILTHSLGVLMRWRVAEGCLESVGEGLLVPLVAYQGWHGSIRLTVQLLLVASGTAGSLPRMAWNHEADAGTTDRSLGPMRLDQWDNQCSICLWPCTFLTSAFRI